MNVNAEIETLKQQVAELQLKSRAMEIAYRIMARELAGLVHLDLQQLQATMHLVVEELENCAQTHPHVPVHLRNLAYDVLYDFFFLQGMGSQNASKRIAEIREDERRWREGEQQ